MPAEPRATYRVQLHAGFGFDDAAALAGYLADLGISHLYSSPYLQAAPGSTHGYDVVDPTRVNEELGGAAGHERLGSILGRHGLGQVLDIVPNHMAITGPENPWWWDVLENGPSSLYAPYFDVAWDPPESHLRNLVLIPVLGDHYGRVLEAGELCLARDGGNFTIRYYDHLLPVAPRSLDRLLDAAAVRASSDDLAFIADALARLPPSTATDRRSVERRHRDKEVLRRQLARHCAERPEAGAAIDAVIAEINADHDALDELLERQNFRLAYWRTAGRDLGYRRFFDVTTLIGLRAEDQRVFADTHALLLRWLAEGVLDGLRIDHPDGLRDPEEYLRRLHAARPDAWIVVEKILESDEELRSSWPVAGTTGYDFLNRVGGLFVDPAGEEPLTSFYADFTGQPTEFRTLTYETKHLVMRDVLGSEVNRLTALFLDVCERHRRHRDHTRHDLHEALREVTACFPVYRTYVRAAAGHVEEADVRYVEAAVDRARSNRPDIDPDLLDFLRDLLLLRVTGRLEAELVMRFQQLTGAVMAKGVEDTAFYRFHRLVSLNEVGGDPARFGFPVADFHAACAETAEWWPRAMLSTSTHDTKRSEDVRARINVLSEIPDRWAEAVGRWSAWNESYRRGDLPDRNAEYLFYQTLIGAWPLEVERAVAYMEKATREAKQHTSWTDPNDTYEEALREFVRGALGDMGFVTDLEGFVSGIIAPARVSSVAQTLIKLTAPGVPDIYQGAELWDLSLVDPDNRRPVDHGQRAALLSRLAGAVDPEAVLHGMDEGLPKLWVVRQALRLRARRPEWFGRYGAYEPLEARGTRAGHVVAFARGGGSVTVVPRLVAGLADGWEDTTLALPGMRWRNELTGDDLYAGDVPLGEVLARFPVALLASADDEA